MRHGNHRHQLGVKKEHRIAMMAALATALFKHGRITTTLAKAKALRPFAERIITLAKKAAAAEDKAVKLHYRRLAIARIRDTDAVRILFNEKAAEFVKRTGGYTRIYKLVPRTSDAAAMGIIELIAGSDTGYKKTTRRKAGTRKAGTATKKSAKKAVAAAESAVEEIAEASQEPIAAESKAE